MHTVAASTGAPLRRLACARLTTWLTTCAMALRRAESFGDISGIIAAQWAYGTVLLRADKSSRIEAIDALERAQHNHPKHRVMTITLATMGADLAIDAARRGRRDEAIDDLRASFSLHMGGGSRVFVGLSGRGPGHASYRSGIRRRPRRGASNRRPVAGPAARHSRARPLVAEITRAVGRGGRQLRRLRRAGQPVPRAVRETRRPRPACRSASNGAGDDGEDTGIHLACTWSPVADECAAVGAVRTWPHRPSCAPFPPVSRSRRSSASPPTQSIHGSRTSHSMTGRQPTLLPR